MSDDDLIRRGDVLRLLQSGAGLTRNGQARRVAALPAVTPGVKVKPGVIERAVWSAMLWAASNNVGFEGVPEYTDKGNSFAETEARAAATRILAALDLTPQPSLDGKTPDQLRSMLEWEDRPGPRRDALVAEIDRRSQPAHAPDVAGLVAEVAAAAKDRAADAPEWKDSDTIGIQISVKSLRAARAALAQIKGDE